MNKYDEQVISKFGKVARGFDRPPVVLSLKEQLMKCGTSAEKTAIRRKDAEDLKNLEQEKLVQKYDIEPDTLTLNS